MEDGLMDDLFEDFDIVTKKEYIMLYNKVLCKIPIFGMLCEITKAAIKDETLPLHFNSDMVEEEKQYFEDNGLPHLFILIVKDSLTELVNDDNPKKKIYELIDNLFKHVCIFDKSDLKTVNKTTINILMALIMYVILYYRYRDVVDYSKYILPTLAESFLGKLLNTNRLKNLNALIEALPPHDETEEERKRLENIPEAGIRDMLVSANEEIRQLRMRIVDLEAQLNDAQNDAGARDGDDGEELPRFYKRKLQLALLTTVMSRAGVDVSRNKSAAAILFSNLLHFSNVKSIQNMLSESLYLRTAEHGEACAEANGILRELGAQFGLECKASKSAPKGEIPIKDYIEILKKYKKSGG